MRRMKTEDRAVAFLYLLMRDWLTSGKVEQIMEDVEIDKTFHLTNGYLGAHARDIARRLFDKPTRKV